MIRRNKKAVSEAWENVGVTMKAYEVFTPTDVPTVTYVDREEQNLEQQLRLAIKTPGLMASLSGPSKSGKTVLVKKVISQDNLIAVSGAAIRSAEMLWERVLNWMEAPSETTTTSGHTMGVQAAGKVSGKTSLLIASGEAEGAIKGSYEHERSKEKRVAHVGIDQVINEIANSDFVVFIDDFHYMAKDTQKDVAKQMKEAADICAPDFRRSYSPPSGKITTPETGHSNFEMQRRN